MAMRVRGLTILIGLAFAFFLALAGTVGSPPARRPPVQHASIPVQERDRINLTAEQRLDAAAKSAPLGEIKSLIKVAKPLHYGEFVWNDKNVPAGPAWIRADLKTQTISIFRGGHEIGTAVILYGANRKPTPPGSFAVLAKSKDHRSRQYDAPMPYSLWLTSDGVAIHGSNVRWGAATHGCVGVPTEFARHLFEAAKVGDRVDIAA